MEQQGDSFTFTVQDSNGFDGLYTLRQSAEESTKDFQKRIKEQSEWLKIDGFSPKHKYGEVKSVSAPVKTSTTSAPIGDKPCPIHNVSMQGKNGKFGMFWSHKTDTGWCNGKPKADYKSY